MLAPGLLKFNAQEDLLRYRFQIKLFMNVEETVYPRTNKSGSTSRALSEDFIYSFSFYTREFSYCITFRFKTLPSKAPLFSWDFQQSGQIVLSMVRVLRFKCRSSSCLAVAYWGWLNAECHNVLCCCPLKLTVVTHGMTYFLVSNICHRTVLSAVCFSVHPRIPFQKKPQLTAPFPCLTLKNYFSLWWNVKMMVLTMAVYMCVMYKSAYSGSQTAAFTT